MSDLAPSKARVPYIERPTARPASLDRHTLAFLSTVAGDNNTISEVVAIEDGSPVNEYITLEYHAVDLGAVADARRFQLPHPFDLTAFEKIRAQTDAYLDKLSKYDNCGAVYFINATINTLFWHYLNDIVTIDALLDREAARRRAEALQPPNYTPSPSRSPPSSPKYSPHYTSPIAPPSFAPPRDPRRRPTPAPWIVTDPSS